MDGLNYSASKPMYRSAHASRHPSTACVWPSKDASPHPKFPSSSVILTNSHRGGTRKYSIDAILPMVCISIFPRCNSIRTFLRSAQLFSLGQFQTRTDAFASQSLKSSCDEAFTAILVLPNQTFAGTFHVGDAVWTFPRIAGQASESGLGFDCSRLSNPASGAGSPAPAQSHRGASSFGLWSNCSRTVDGR